MTLITPHFRGRLAVQGMADIQEGEARLPDRACSAIRRLFFSTSRMAAWTLKSPVSSLAAFVGKLRRGITPPY
jgi:hypothetical protein